MLTGKMVRVRYLRGDRLVPYYLDTRDEAQLELADQLIDLFRDMRGHTRGELEEMLEETFGDDSNTLIHQGLAKLLEDRCDFEVSAGHPPEQLRQLVFQAASRSRQSDDADNPAGVFDRLAVLESVARGLNLPVEMVEKGLFADLKSEQKLIDFKDLTAEQFLCRHNVALAQAVLLRAISVHVTIEREPPQRYRQLVRAIKFHRLMCEFERTGPDRYTLHLDGPLSLFSATQKYGLQLALFLPTLLLCKNFTLEAELRWGTQRKPRKFHLSHKDKLVTHVGDFGTFVPPELGLFVDSFRKRISDWELQEETEVYQLGSGFWVPDFRLIERSSGKTVLLEVMGFWRKSHAVKHLQYLRHYADRPFLLAVSDQLHIEETLDELPVGIHRFRNMPLADEIARLAAEALRQAQSG